MPKRWSEKFLDLSSTLDILPMQDVGDAGSMLSTSTAHRTSMNGTMCVGDLSRAASAR